MMEITFLGTGCMMPTKTRNHSGILVTRGKENMLFDCGEGIQRQMRIAGVKPAKITRLLISHWHGDHVFGIPGLMSSMGADQYADKLIIYGPLGSKNYFEHLFKSFAAKSIIPYEVHEVKEGMVFETDEFVVEARKMRHSVPCLGYMLIEKDRRRVNLAKAKKFGLSEGPELGNLQLGKSVMVKGKKINPDDVTYIVKGKKLSYVADTTLCQGANELAQDADLLISEGTHLSEIEEKSEKYMHLTVKDAAIMASENNVERLIVTHISPRYKHPTDILAEAKDYFENVVIAEDFMKFKL